MNRRKAFHAPRKEERPIAPFSSSAEDMARAIETRLFDTLGLNPHMIRAIARILLREFQEPHRAEVPELALQLMAGRKDV